MVVVLACDSKLAKFLLSNPILLPGAPQWLQIKAPGEPLKLWLYVPDGVYNPADRRTKKA